MKEDVIGCISHMEVVRNAYRILAKVEGMRTL
jgi:hypothetical protein